jgi:cytoskeletal protein CcmA (bactofilin family)
MKGQREREVSGNQATISIIGPGMEVEGDCLVDGTLRVEGTLTGTVYAGKAVVVGKEGVVRGEIRTHDALIAGEVTGTLLAASRLEIQATAKVQGEIRSRRLQLEEGAILNGEIHMGDVELGSPPTSRKSKGPGATPTSGQKTDRPAAKEEGPKFEMEPASAP